MSPVSEQRGVWRPAIVAAGLMALGFVRALSWQLVNQRSNALRLTPRGEHLLAALSLALPLIPAFALLWSAMTRRLQTRLAVTLVLLVVLGAAGGFAAMFAWVPLFDGHYAQSVTSPDGAREAHLWSGGFLGCKGAVYVADRGALWGDLVTERQVDCDTMSVQWVPDGGVEMSGDGPKPFPLFLGPH